jgi:hypothetical protein
MNDVILIYGETKNRKSAKIIHILQIKLKNVILEVIEADIHCVNLGH